MVKSAIITFEKANAFNVVLQINMVNKLFEQHLHSSLAVAIRSRKQLKILYSLTLRLWLWHGLKSNCLAGRWKQTSHWY